ncbi:hypothetical protein KDW_03400 [Dictyobacter vulcani]|uniref:Uncharacterized protein n=1 Tax=Dictyobacter vulcani TaxID=2607529 RepID=A0A5J4KBY6_9CHLR|nr:hypothetical protein KDW_03400 [Dictyobacter vulcani]
MNRGIKPGRSRGASSARKTMLEKEPGNKKELTLQWRGSPGFFIWSQHNTLQTWIGITFL